LKSASCFDWSRVVVGPTGFPSRSHAWSDHYALTPPTAARYSTASEPSCRRAANVIIQVQGQSGNSWTFSMHSCNLFAIAAKST
jgi:hypothetical protein